MKLNYFIVFFALTFSAFSSCKKTTTASGEDPHNHDLLKKPLEQIKAEIAGRWQIKRTHFFRYWRCWYYCKR